MNCLCRINNVALMLALWPGLCLAQNEPMPAGAAPVPSTVPGTLQEVVQKLAPESRAKLGELLTVDWKDRPEWAEMLIALLKNEEMKGTIGWFKPSHRKYDWTWLTARFDANKDGVIDKEELSGESIGFDRLFARLDRDNDGKLKSTDFDYANQPPTPPVMMSRFLPRLLDTDTNGRITPEELQAFLKRADKDQTGFLTAEDLYGEFSRAFNAQEGDDMPSPDELLAMFFRGELGIFESGPKLGDVAPDFALPTHDGNQTVTLSSLRGKPVILIFGSFT
jgi:Ca2+-binding EF-hand superfamily protein